jgi:hypothetical protein
MIFKKSQDVREIKAQMAVMSSVLAEARKFIMSRGIYYYNSEMRGVGSELVKKIDAVTQEHK